MHDRHTSYRLTVAALLLALAAAFAGPANARPTPSANGSDAVSAATPATAIPYVGHRVGVDESRFIGTASATPPATSSPAESDRWYAWGVAGVAGGAALTALILATLSTLSFRSRQGRTAMS